MTATQVPSRIELRIVSHRSGKWQSLISPVGIQRGAEAHMSSVRAVIDWESDAVPCVKACVSVGSIVVRVASFGRVQVWKPSAWRDVDQNRRPIIGCRNTVAPHTSYRSEEDGLKNQVQRWCGGRVQLPNLVRNIRVSPRRKVCSIAPLHLFQSVLGGDGNSGQFQVLGRSGSFTPK